MKALLSLSAGGPEALQILEVAQPEPVAGEILISVKACAINYPDVLIIEDKYQFKPERPFSPGCEVAGVVAAIGAGVDGWAVGDRVIGTAIHGGLAQFMALPAHACFRLPEDKAFEDGAALLLTYATTIHALRDRGHVAEGDTLLVLGAAGGVGLAAVELGKSFGARVIGAVSSQEKADAVIEAGADEALIYPRGVLDRDASRSLAEQFKAAVGPQGANLIFDAVGGGYAEPALRAIAWEGRYLVVGFPAGIPKLPLNLTLLKSCDVCGVFWGAFATRSPERNRRNVDDLFKLWDAGRISPRVTQMYTFADAPKAIAALGNRSVIGKAVVTID